MRTLIIAEAGSTHDGSIEKALRLVDVANACFADCVKFQFWSSPERLAERRHPPHVWTDPEARQLAIDRAVHRYCQYQLPRTWLPTLRDHANTLGLEFMCSVFLEEDIATIAPFVERFKVSAFESSDRRFLDAHSPYGKPVIASEGMSAGPYNRPAEPPPFYRLHCVSAYPAPIEDLNLSVLHGDIRFDGFSDHSRHVIAGAVAVACGARILEVHYRLHDTAVENPDYAAALSPYELTEYIWNVRDAELMIGDGIKRRMPSEEPMAKYRVVA